MPTVVRLPDGTEVELTREAGEEDEDLIERAFRVAADHALEEDPEEAGTGRGRRKRQLRKLRTAGRMVWDYLTGD